MKAPEFNLPDQNGQIHSLADYKGHWLVLYFYPKDDTPGCTKEACSFRDNIGRFKKAGAEVVGISKDSVKSHKKFEQKHKLNFTVLSDPAGEVIEKYGSWGSKSMFGRTFLGILRNTYLINPEGVIVKKYEKVNPAESPELILQDLATFTIQSS